MQQHQSPKWPSNKTSPSKVLRKVTDVCSVEGQEKQRRVYGDGQGDGQGDGHGVLNPCFDSRQTRDLASLSLAHSNLLPSLLPAIVGNKNNPPYT